MRDEDGDAGSNEQQGRGRASVTDLGARRQHARDVPQYFGPAGPYGTESEALAASRVRALAADDVVSSNLDRLMTAVAGVDLGSFDMAALRAVAELDPGVVEALAGIMSRIAD